MAPSTKTVQVQIMSNCDVFHELWKSNPHEVPNLTPTTIQNCQILEGEVGTEGCVLLWHYFLGKPHIYAITSFFIRNYMLTTNSM